MLWRGFCLNTDLKNGKDEDEEIFANKIPPPNKTNDLNKSTDDSGFPFQGILARKKYKKRRKKNKNASKLNNKKT